MQIYSEKVKNAFFISSVSALCFLSSMIYTSYVEEQFRFPKELLFQFISFTSALVFVLYTLTQENSLSGFLRKSEIRKKELRPIHLLLLFFVATVLLSSLFSSQTYFSSLYLVNFFSGLLLFYLMFFLRFDEDNIKTILLFCFLGGLVNALYGLVQINDMDFLFESSGYKSSGRNIGGFIDNANTFACFISVIFPLTLSLFFINKNIFLKLFFGISLLLFALALYYSQTRGAIAATLAATAIFLTVYCLFTKQTKLLLISALVISVMILGLLASPQTALYKRITFQGETALTAQNERLIQWLVAIEMFKENPFLGVGPGGYQYKYKDYEIKVKEKNGSPFYGLSFYVAKHAHNEFLQLLAEIGLIGFLLFASLLSYYFYRVYVLVKALAGRKKRKKLFLINLGIACSSVAFLVTATTSLPFHITPCIVIPVVLSGYQLMCINRYV